MSDEEDMQANANVDIVDDDAGWDDDDTGDNDHNDDDNNDNNDNNNDEDGDAEMNEMQSKDNEDGDWGDDDNLTGDDWAGTSVVAVANSVKSDDGDIDMGALKKSRSVVALTRQEIDLAIQKKIQQLKDQIELNEHDCLLLLRKFKWNVAQVMDAYFLDTDKVRLEAGICLDPKPPKLKSGQIECQVCMEDVDVRNVFSLECGHQTTCNPCWVDYLKDAVRTKECVNLPCPAYKCNTVIREEYWKQFLSEKYPSAWDRYKKFCRENFVECNKDYAFCPGKNCDMTYSSSAGVAKEMECKHCGLCFCWACKQESHFPASCEVARQWNSKNSDEAENLQWILAKTKKCPKCSVPIEKNQGCNHMTCRKNVGGCGHEFCWLCKGDWKDHGSETGGYYQCNIYEKQKTDGTQSDEEKKTENAANELERYEFHWTRFDSHIKSSNHAKKELTRTHERMHELSQKFQWRLHEANFLLEAVQEAIKCWHVLAWTYPIAYYMDQKTNIQLFKEQQGTLETFCNGLQAKLDFDLDKLGDNKTRQEVIHYTRTSAQYRKNLVEYIEAEISI